MEVLNYFFAQGVVNLPIKKLPGGFAGGGGNGQAWN